VVSKFSFLKKPLNKYIDHTLLKPDASLKDFQKLIDEAVTFDFASVCVSPYMALTVGKMLKEHPNVKICTVVGFPLGNTPALIKSQEALFFGDHGVHEIDFVINIGMLKSGMVEHLQNEIRALDKICKDRGVISKCIVETCYLTDEEKMLLYKILDEKTTVDYIKTSTGFGSSSAQVGDVAMWNAHRQQKIAAEEESNLLVLHDMTRENGLKIKAAGGIKDLDTALAFIAAGADRLGMSASVKVMEEYNAHPDTFTEREETS